MNEASKVYGLGVYVYQKAGAWYADYRGKVYQFEGDRLELSRYGAGA
jgi:hypothetical protein